MAIDNSNFIECASRIKQLDTAKKSFPYGSKEEAERRLEEKVQKRKTTLCPLMSATCSADCVCYIKPYVVDLNPGKTPFWECKGGFCTCYSLVGPD